MEGKGGKWRGKYFPLSSTIFPFHFPLSGGKIPPGGKMSGALLGLTDRQERDMGLISTHSGKLGGHVQYTPPGGI